MSMTVAQLTQYVLSLVDDEQAAYFNANDTFTWFNLAQRQVQLELLNAGQNYYMIPVETYTVPGQADYLLPSDFITEHRLEVVVSGTGTQENRQPLSPITTNQQDLVSIVQGTPTNYILKKDRFTVSPTPDQAYLMRLYYSPLIQDLVSTTSVPDVPGQFVEYVALLAAYNCYIKDDRAPDQLVAKINSFKQLLEQVDNDRTQDLPRQVVITDPLDGQGSWF